jgi:hypothetical protein
MEHFSARRPRQESTMTEPARPKMNRVKYAAMLLGTAAIVAVPSVGLAAVASAQFNEQNYKWCQEGIKNTPELEDWMFWDMKKDCCLKAGGVWDPKQRECKEDKMDTRTLPGNSQIPSDIATAPVTNDPPRPIQVPSDIATVSTVSQGN